MVALYLIQLLAVMTAHRPVQPAAGRAQQGGARRDAHASLAELTPGCIDCSTSASLNANGKFGLRPLLLGFDGTVVTGVCCNGEAEDRDRFLPG